MRTRLVAAALFLAACPLFAQPAPQAQPASTAAPQTKVTLSSPGAEPRRPLRFTPAPGSTQSTEMVIKTTQQSEMGGMPARTLPMPTIAMPMLVTVVSIAENGDINESVTFGLPTATSEDPQMAPMLRDMNQGLAGLQDATATAVVSNRGVVREATFKLAAGGDPMLEQMADEMSHSMRQFSVPVPEEAVGVGGVWVVEFETELQGIRSNHKATYTLREFTEDGCTLDVRVVQSATKQEVKNPGLPPGVMLESFAGESTGWSTFAFDRVMPVDATSKGNVKSHMTVEQGGEVIDIKQTVQMEMILREVQAGAAPAVAPQ